jgi:Skp family chaperone for outer membrane proteins
MIEKFVYVLLVTALMTVCVFAQTPTPTPVNLEMILTEAEKQTANYQETFRDLLATETKTFESYDKNGEPKERTVIESIFLVYQSSKDGRSSAELRNIVKKDDKLVPDSQARADRFLAELEKTTTLEKELEKIQQEGSRYDKTLEISGFTLYEGIALSTNLRSVFDFKLLGSENYREMKFM